MLKINFSKPLIKITFLFLFLNINLFLLVPLGNLLTACNTTEPPPPETKPTLSLALEDASCTEAWLQLTTKDLELPAELTLKQYNPTGDSLSKNFMLNTQDSLLYIDSLLPNKNYSFKVSRASCIKYQVSHNRLQQWTQPATTLLLQAGRLALLAAVCFTMLQ
jgi:hypothetical protein